MYMIWQFVKNLVNIVTVSITYAYWTQEDVRVKKDEHLESQKYYLNLK